MKQFITLVLVCQIAYVLPQDNAIDNANKLIENKKYESAMKILENADPNNQNPEIVIAKSDLLLNYFTKSIMHRFFGLADLRPSDDLMELRDRSGNFNMFTFAPDSILEGLIIQYPTNYKLYKALGDYYYQVYLKYPNCWFIPDNEVINKVKENYIIAYQNQVFDYWSLYGIGYSYLLVHDYNNAINYFEKSVEQKNDYPSSHYNLAYSYLFLNLHEKAIVSAKKSLNLYDNLQYKGDAARMIGAIYYELNVVDSALTYYLLANKFAPNDYYTIRPLLEIEINKNNESYKDRTLGFFQLAPDNPTIYKDLLQIYYKKGKQDELISFFEKQKSNYQNDYKVLGNLFFYIGTIQFDNADLPNAKENFLKAKECFQKVLDSEHQVFNVIKSYLDKI